MPEPTPPEAWAPARTIGDLLGQLADLTEVEVDDTTIARFSIEEAAFRVAVSTHHFGPNAVVEATAALGRIYDTDVCGTRRWVAACITSTTRSQRRAL